MMDNNTGNNIEIIEEEELFLTKYNYLWNKDCISDMFKVLKNFQQISPSRSLTELIIELEMAHNKFVQDIKDLPVIMNCRTKTSTDSHFGGLQCINFMESIVRACDKYLNIQTDIKPSNNTFEDGSLNQIIYQTKLKAKHCRTFAREIENTNKSTYNNSGIDNSAEIFRSAGYTI